jgi:hypothetical protein
MSSMSCASICLAVCAKELTPWRLKLPHIWLWKIPAILRPAVIDQAEVARMKMLTSVRDEHHLTAIRLRNHDMPVITGPTLCVLSVVIISVHMDGDIATTGPALFA